MRDDDDEPGREYGVVFPDVPGCMGAGETRMEAAREAAEALASHMSLLADSEAARDRFRNHRRDWSEKRAADLRRQLALLRSGKMRTHEDRGAGEVETTVQNIAHIEGWLAELAASPALDDQP